MTRVWMLWASIGMATACAATRPPGASAPIVPTEAAKPVGPAAVAKVDRPSRAVREGSTIALGLIDEKRVLYVADEDEHLVRVIDAENQDELGATELDGRPGQLIVLADGSVAVTVRDRNRVDIMSAERGAKAPLRVRGSVTLPPEPLALALSLDDGLLVVASGWGQAVTTVDARTFSIKQTYSVPREPRSVTVTSDGKRALVVHAAGGNMTTIALDAADPKTAVTTKALPFVERSRGGERLTGRVAELGYALAKTKGSIEGRVLVPQTLAFPGDPTIASSGYGASDERLAPEVFNVAVLDERRSTPLGISLELPSDADRDADGKPERTCLLPRAAAVGGRELLVACLGNDSIVAYDAASAQPRSARRRKFDVPEGPTGIAVDDSTGEAWVWSQFARATSVIRLAASADELGQVQSSSMPHHLPTTVDDPRVAFGRRLFHSSGDKRIANDGRACASCHFEGRDDGLVWSTPNGPRQTPMLAGRTAGTEPYSWQGDAKSVELHLVHTMQRLGGTGLPVEEREAIAKYLEVMPGPPDPQPPADPAVQRGAAIFASAEAGCSGCHGVRGDEPDGIPHDVKSKASADTQKRFDTPSLKHLAGTAPYFHDGRYADLGSLLKATDGKMGSTKHLTADDRKALETFLRTL